jgi:hypothetical protein
VSVSFEFQKRVSVKRSYVYVTGVGHTSLSSASIRSGEIIIPSSFGSARVSCPGLRFVQSYLAQNPKMACTGIYSAQRLIFAFLRPESKHMVERVGGTPPTPSHTVPHTAHRTVTDRPREPREIARS